MSLVVTAVSTTALQRRQRRQATVEAWIAWSDNNADGRRCLSNYLGVNKITTEQARGLADESDLISKTGEVLSAEDRRQVIESLATILNGLERIAVGARLRVYDPEILRRLGATIIVRTYVRFEPYIEYRRTTQDLDRRQARAYLALTKYVAELRRSGLDRDRLRRTGEVRG